MTNTLGGRLATHDANSQPVTSYRFLYNFLLVLTEEQISKLRNIAIGIKNLSSFSEREIRELEMKLDRKTLHNE